MKVKTTSQRLQSQNNVKCGALDGHVSWSNGGKYMYCNMSGLCIEGSQAERGGREGLGEKAGRKGEEGECNHDSIFMLWILLFISLYSLLPFQLEESMKNEFLLSGMNST